MKMKEALTAQKVWGWKVAAYLFLAGMGAGVYLIGFILSLTNPALMLLSKVTVILAAPLVIAGLFFLLLDLGHKTIFPLVYLRPLSSWIARGTIIVTLFVILDLIHIGIWIWPDTWLAGMPVLLLALGSVTSAFAVLTMIYTGLLLGAAKPIKFWSPVVLPVLFMVSGISTGIMGAALVLSIYGLSAGIVVEQPLTLLAHYDLFIIIVEAIIICFYLCRMYQLTDARTSVSMVLAGSLAVRFWGGVVAAGLVIPLAFELNVVYVSTVKPIAMLVPTAVTSIVGLFGGLMLRHIIVAGGARTPLNVEGVFIHVSDTYEVY